MVGLQWKLEGGKLRIVDKEGAAGVMKKLAEKREELTKKAGAAK